MQVDPQQRKGLLDMLEECCGVLNMVFKMTQTVQLENEIVTTFGQNYSRNDVLATFLVDTNDNGYGRVMASLVRHFALSHNELLTAIDAKWR